MEMSRKENRYKRIILTAVRTKWKDILLKVQSNIGCSNTYSEIMFSHLKVENVLDDKLYVLAPDEVIVNILNERYLQEIEEAIKEMLGMNLRVEATVMDHNKCLELVKKFWPRVLQQVKRNLGVSDESFDTFLKYLKVYSVYNNTLIVMASDDILMKYVSKKYGEEIEKVVNSYINKTISVEFISPKYPTCQ